MNCCQVQAERKPRRWWSGAGGGAGSAALLVLLPKCPLCIAAYLAVFTGAGAAMSIATRLRPLLEVALIASLTLLLVRSLMTRLRPKPASATCCR